MYKCTACNKDATIKINGTEKTYMCDECFYGLKDVAQQKHYTQWDIQPITFIVANKLNFCQGNVIKYVMRYNQKNGLEDLKKAKVYIDYLIQELETGEVKP